jgi:hypothetical protein
VLLELVVEFTLQFLVVVLLVGIDLTKSIDFTLFLGVVGRKRVHIFFSGSLLGFQILLFLLEKLLVSIKLVIFFIKLFDFVLNS